MEIMSSPADCEKAEDLSLSSPSPSPPSSSMSIGSYMEMKHNTEGMTHSLDRVTGAQSLGSGTSWLTAFEDKGPRSATRITSMTHFENRSKTNGSSVFKDWRWYRVNKDCKGGPRLLTPHYKKKLVTLNVIKGELVLIVSKCSVCQMALCPYINVLTSQNKTGTIEKHVLSDTPIALSCKVDQTCEKSQFQSEQELADHYIRDHFWHELCSLLPPTLKRCPVNNCNFRSNAYKDLVYHYGGKPSGQYPIPHRFILSQFIINSLEKRIPSLSRDQNSLQRGFLHLQTKIESEGGEEDFGGKVSASENKALEEEITYLRQAKENLEKELQHSKLKFEQDRCNQDKQVEKWIDNCNREKANELRGLRTKVGAQEDEILGWKNRYNACQDRVNQLISVSARDDEFKDKVIQELQEKLNKCSIKDQINLSEKKCLEQKIISMKYKDKKMCKEISNLRESLRTQEAELGANELHEKIEQLKSCNLELCKEKEELRKNLMKTKCQLKSKENKLDEVSKTEKGQREMIKELLGEVEKRDTKLIEKKDCTPKFKAIESELEKTKIKLQEKQNDFDNLSKSVREITEELKQTGEKQDLETKSKMKVISAQKEEINYLVEKMKSTEKELGQVKERLAAVIKDFEGRTKKFDDYVIAKREERNGLKNTLMELKHLYEEVKTKFGLALAERKTLESANLTLKKANEHLLQEKMQLEKDLKSATKNTGAEPNAIKLEKMCKTVSTLTLENNKQKKEIKQLFGESKDYPKVCSSLNKVKKELQICKNDLEESILSKDSAMLEVQERDLVISEYKSTVQDLSAKIVELSDKEKEFKELTRDLEAARTEVVEAQTEVQHRDEEIEKLKESLGQTASTTRTTEVSHNKCEKEIAGLQKKNSFLKTSLEHRNKELNTLLNDFGSHSLCSTSVKRARNDSIQDSSAKKMKIN